MNTQLPSIDPFPGGRPPRAAVLDDAAREAQRLLSLDAYDVLDTPREEPFDRITRMVRRLVKTPIAIVSFIDGHRQWFKSCDGGAGREAPRRDTLCKHTIMQREPLVISDAQNDPRFADNPSVAGPPHVRAYLGVPLRSRDGENIGTLCAVDMRVRQFDAGEIELMADLAEMVMDELELRRLADRDSLTGAYSRRAFKDDLARSTALALRHHHQLAMIMLDVDHFKSVNDTHGHAAGDLVLASIGQSVVDQLRHTDIFGRLGGEEFAVLLPNTGLEAALGVAEKLRTSFERQAIALKSGSLSFTASFGVAALGADIRDVDTLVQRADQALYEAKAAGRNRCAVWRAPKGENRTPGQRVLKAGQIIFNGNTSIVDCTVRSLSAEGAGLDIFSSIGIPAEFVLAIRADDLSRTCRVLARKVNHLDVAFS